MKAVAGKFEVTTFGLRERSYLSIFAEKRPKVSLLRRSRDYPCRKCYPSQMPLKSATTSTTHA